MNDNDLRHPYVKYVVWALAAAIIALSWVMFCVFLSSKAEAHSGHGIAIPISRHVNGFPDSRLRHAGVIWEEPRSAFERPQEPVKWLLQWPRLPSVDEIRIKMAKEQLALEIAAEEAMKPFQWPWDWEDFKKALGLALVSLGVMISITYGRTAVRMKNSI